MRGRPVLTEYSAPHNRIDAISRNSAILSNSARYNGVHLLHAH